MKRLLMIILVVPTLAMGANLKPGLWQVDMKMKQGKDFIDPMAEMKKAMANMPAKQREQMMKMMSSRGAGMGMTGQNLTACFTKEMLDESKLFAHTDAGNCATKILDKTDEKMHMSFNCSDGSKGTAKWNIENEKSYNGIVSMVTKDGKKADMKYDMKFLDPDCGDVKPRL